MDAQKIMDRVKGILLNPRQEWQQIKTEPTSNKELVLYYVVPFAALAALISFIVIWSNTYLGFGLALRYAVLQFLQPIIAVVITAFVVNELADSFNSTKNLNNAFKIVTYGYIPALLAGIIASISWTLNWVGIFGLYGAYLLWIGLPALMDTPDEKRMVYIVAIAILFIVINLIVSALFGINRLGYY